jgi:hypothetical protein
MVGPRPDATAAPRFEPGPPGPGSSEASGAHIGTPRTGRGGLVKPTQVGVDHRRGIGVRTGALTPQVPTFPHDQDPQNELSAEGRSLLGALAGADFQLLSTHRTAKKSDTRCSGAPPTFECQITSSSREHHLRRQLRTAIRASAVLWCCGAIVDRHQKWQRPPDSDTQYRL